MECHSRASIHAQGAFNFKNDPGLTSLTAEVNKGEISQKKLVGAILSNEEYTKLSNLIEKRIESENIIKAYTDTLILAWNTRLDTAKQCVPNP
jgi:hypothetical protein